MLRLLASTATLAVMISTASATGTPESCNYDNSGRVSCSNRIMSVGHIKRTAHVRHKREHIARQKSERPKSNQVTSHKTGVVAYVAPAYADKFQALIDDLEVNYGATIYYMGGWRPGRCGIGSQHPCGWAMDICQDSRGHVSGEKDCHLPVPAVFAKLIKSHGLYDGGSWCDTDYGHVQAKPSGGSCPPTGWVGNGHNHYLALMTGGVEVDREKETKVVSAKRKSKHRYAHRYKHRHYAKA